MRELFSGSGSGFGSDISSDELSSICESVSSVSLDVVDVLSIFEELVAELDGSGPQATKETASKTANVSINIFFIYDHTFLYCRL